MSETKSESNRNLILIIGAVVALLLMCCCIVLAAFAALAIVRSEDSGGEIIVTVVPSPEEPGTSPISIQSFTVEPQRILAGECAVLEWSVRGADSVQLLRDGAPLLENGALEDSYKDCLDQPGVYRYRLEAQNNTGFYQWMELQVIVDAGS